MVDAKRIKELAKRKVEMDKCWEDVEVAREQHHIAYLKYQPFVELLDSAKARFNNRQCLYGIIQREIEIQKSIKKESPSG